MNAAVTNQQTRAGKTFSGGEMVTFMVDGQTFGLSALRVRDVLREQPLTKVPLASPEIAGAINLRGHIVTAIDLRARLGVPAPERGAATMCVVVEKGPEQFCLIVDSVGDVISVTADDIEPPPSSLPAAWVPVTRGLYRMSDKLLLVVDIDQLLTW